jgi:ribonuclease HII
MAGAVVLRPDCYVAGIADSKVLTAEERERLFDMIVAAAVSCRSVLLQSHAAQEGRGTSTVGKSAEDAQRILALNSDAGGEAVQIHSHPSEFREQLLESSLVSHAIHPLARPCPRFRDDGACLTR